MNSPYWQTALPFDAIIFDCDGTLSKIEGIDELARMNHVYEEVEALTTSVMENALLNEDVYSRRLDLVMPTLEQLNNLGQLYIQQVTPNVDKVVELFSFCQKELYIMSAGLTPSVMIFGEHLGFKKENIFAVDLSFDTNGCYDNFDRGSPLINSMGKREIICRLKEKHNSLLLIGDGMNDVTAKAEVNRFVGFGGAFRRQRVEAKSDFYILCPDMSALIPLVLTQKEELELPEDYRSLYLKGMRYLEDEQVIVKKPISEKGYC